MSRLRLIRSDKICKGCGNVLPLSSFDISSKKRPDQYAARCRPCKMEQRKKSQNYKIVNKRNKIKRDYGLSWEQYKNIIDAQNGKCVICSIEFDLTPVRGGSHRNSPHIDHCHNKGHVRGILCSQCNRGLGCFSDNTNSLQNAIAYLRRN